MQTLTTCLEYKHSEQLQNGNLHNLFQINWKHVELVYNGNIHNFFGINWKHSQLFWNKMETFKTSF